MSRRSVSETPRTVHRGYSIHYGDNDEEWHCNDLKMQAAKLSTLKGKIDRWIKRHNDENGVRCLNLGGYNGIRDALVIGIYPRTRLEHTPDGNKDIRRVYVKWMRKRSDGSERATLHERDEIDSFIPDTPEVRAMLREVERLEAGIEQATKRRDDYIAAIPRVTEDMFAGLVPDEADSEAAG
jgi:hypothetical protein